MVGRLQETMGDSGAAARKPAVAKVLAQRHGQRRHVQELPRGFRVETVVRLRIGPEALRSCRVGSLHDAGGFFVGRLHTEVLSPCTILRQSGSEPSDIRPAI